MRNSKLKKVTCFISIIFIFYSVPSLHAVSLDRIEPLVQFIRKSIRSYIPLSATLECRDDDGEVQNIHVIKASIQRIRKLTVMTLKIKFDNRNSTNTEESKMLNETVKFCLEYINPHVQKPDNKLPLSFLKRGWSK